MLDHNQRATIRRGLANLDHLSTELEYSLRRGTTLPAETTAMLVKLSQTKNRESQLRMIQAAHDDSLAEYMGQLQAMAPNDLTAFSEFIHPEEPPAPHHVWMCERLMEIENGDILRMLLSMPPGHAKSTYASRMFPAWYMGKNPKHRYIQAGHTQNFCENEFGKKTKAIVDSDKFRLVFPEVGLSSDSKAAGYWSIAGYGGSYLTRGVGQGIAGFRAHCAGVDDPFATREDAESQLIRDKVYDWFSADFTTRVLPNRPMFIVATRWHTDDLCGRVEEINNEKRGLPWYVINLPAFAEDEDDALGRAEGEALWPTFYTVSELRNLQETLLPRDWNSLYRGKPMDTIGGIINSETFNRYRSLPTPECVKRTTLSVDSAQKDNERADFTAITVWVEDNDGNHYLKHVIRKRVEFPELVTLVEAAARVHEVDAILVEDKGSGTQYIQTRAGKAPAPIISINVANQSKTFRFDAVTPLILAGQVHLPMRASWLALFEAELISFPSGKYDDQVDSTSQYLDWSRTTVKRGVVRLQGLSEGTQDKLKNTAIARAIEKGMLMRELVSKDDPIFRQLRDQGIILPLRGDR